MRTGAEAWSKRLLTIDYKDVKSQMLTALRGPETPFSWTVFSRGCRAVRINKSHKEHAWCVFLGGGLRALRSTAGLTQPQGSREGQPLSAALPAAAGVERRRQ